MQALQIIYEKTFACLPMVAQTQLIQLYDYMHLTGEFKEKSKSIWTFLKWIFPGTEYFLKLRRLQCFKCFLDYIIVMARLLNKT